MPLHPYLNSVWRDFPTLKAIQAWSAMSECRSSECSLSYIHLTNSASKFLAEADMRQFEHLLPFLAPSVPFPSSSYDRQGEKLLRWTQCKLQLKWTLCLFTIICQSVSVVKINIYIENKCNNNFGIDLFHTSEPCTSRCTYFAVFTISNIHSYNSNVFCFFLNVITPCHKGQKRKFSRNPFSHNVSWVLNQSNKQTNIAPYIW